MLSEIPDILKRSGYVVHTFWHERMASFNGSAHLPIRLMISVGEKVNGIAAQQIAIIVKMAASTTIKFHSASGYVPKEFNGSTFLIDGDREKFLRDFQKFIEGLQTDFRTPFLHAHEEDF